VGLSFAKAIEELRRLSGQVIDEPHDEEPVPYDLLARVAEVWHQAFCQRPEGLDYLESRGLKDKEMMRLFQAGYCDGEQLLAMASSEDLVQLRRLGIINERGKEFFSRCVVFPLKDREGRIVSFYGRSTVTKAKVPHRFCAGPKLGLFNPEGARGTDRVYLVEGVLDALAFYQAGFPNVMPMGGTQGYNRALQQHLKKELVLELVLCLDGDAAGQAAAEGLTEVLKSDGLRVRNIALPEGQDPLSLLPSLSRAELDSRFRITAPTQSVLRTQPSQPDGKNWKYRKLSGAGGKLRVLVTVSHGDHQAETTLDLYSPRSRRQEGTALARRLGIAPEELEAWLIEVLHELEEKKSEDVGESPEEMFKVEPAPPMTPAEREEALAFLQRPDLVEAILQDMERLGYMGDEEAKLLGYCVSVSRKLEKPMSAIVQSGSGAGKSHLADIIERVTPPEEVVFYTRLSQQALYHMPKDFLMHKLLMLEERVGGEANDYQIRTLQSKSKLVQAIVVKDPATGRLFTRRNEVRGPIAYIETTTNLRLNPENTSRCFEIPLDETPEQTRRIHQRQKALRGLQGLLNHCAEESILSLHHRAQRLLEPVWVVIPFVEQLTFPDRWLRTRRDHERFLCLIEVLAFLHQHQRPRRLHQGVAYIEATVSDYRWAYFLASRVLQNSLDELSRWSRELLTDFESRPAEQVLTRRELRDLLQWPDRRVRDALDELVSLEYLDVLKGPRNLYVYGLSTLRGSVTNTLGLLVPDELERRWAA
jgi:DNA primase